MKHTIIHINGPSSSGKTSLAKELQSILPTPYLHISIDKVIGMMPAKLNNWEGGCAPDGFSWKSSLDAEGHLMQELQMGPFAKKMNQALKEIVLTLIKMNHYVIIDDIAFGSKEITTWKDTLHGYSVLWIGLKSPLSLLETREKSRENRIIGSARAQHLKVHEEICYDMEFDTSVLSTQEIAKTIRNFLLT